ncbi:3-deoxy-manno-octulosonate cytidylyltransferase [Aliamphritea spongicola]|uniref:3-deoxy-manno-octulosonate cytidylyltransferase n=1 Tax=Aliamphritea spongicola TaxID=707589 RepID=UPI00196B2116|nr:3-deoxy-manno-octulosonate cytidylyltransferase [Aliamphritea spongicola]MBN3560953.1 3-deoxy-manno-octulosonate cytidylyltransferase [Aliamphritea spongicola]
MIDYSNVHIVIPARFLSSRLPGKLVADVAGKPLIVRVYENVISATSKIDVIVAVDDIRIADILTTYNIPWCMTSSSHDSGTDRIAEVCSSMGWPETDLVINVQGDEPLLPKGVINDFISFCKENDNFEMATITSPFGDLDDIFDTNVVKVISNKNNFANYFSRSVIPFDRDSILSQEYIQSYQKHIGVYAYNVATLFEITNSESVANENLEKLEQLRALWLGISIKIMNVDCQIPHGVDTSEDLQKVVEFFKDK